jgi:PAT family beta-lactamase induction signal transducer AmpG
MNPAYREVLRSPRLAAILVLGFSSGLPLALTGGTLQAWLTVAGLDVKTIAWFSWIGLPYALKFLWSPFMDRFVPPRLGRRRGWMLITQAALMAGLVAMAVSPPDQSLWVLGTAALWVAFASASQDIVIDAYRTDILKQEERGMGSALTVFGYRLAVLCSGALALILADRIGWQNTYFLMAGLMLVGAVTALAAPEPESPPQVPASLAEAVLRPLGDLLSRPGAATLLALVVLYKLSDALAEALGTTFLIRGAGFSPTDVGLVNKGLGLGALLVGALAGGVLLARMSLARALLLFGVVQAVSVLSFAWLATAGKSYPLLFFAVGFEKFSSGLGTSAFIALLMALCNHAYSATQYALLSAVASLGRILVGPLAGDLVGRLGWDGFFVLTFFAALPGLALVWARRYDIDRMAVLTAPKPAPA